MLWRPSHVGDRRSARMELRGEINGPDGRRHSIAGTTEGIWEALAVDGTFVTQQRYTFVRNEHAFDGVTQPSLTGSFDLTQTDGGLTVTRVGGVITEAERSYFKDAAWSRDGHEALKHFLRQSFKVGAVFTLTPDEISGLGFAAGTGPVSLRVRDVASTAVTFDLDLYGDINGVGRLHAKGTLKLDADGADVIQDGEVLSGTTQIGTMHVEARSHELSH